VLKNVSLLLLREDRGSVRLASPPNPAAIDIGTKIMMRSTISPVYLVACALLFLASSSFSSDNESPDLLPKAPDHLLKNFLASPDSEPGATLFHQSNPQTRSIF
jgi:hypothetical protein